MRKEPFVVGDFVHVYNCGNRKMPIVRDENDRWRLLSILRYFNDANSSLNLLRSLNFSNKPLRSNLNSVDGFAWPKGWPAQEPLVQIVSYALMPNHYHLLLKEIRPGGIAAFMKKLANGYTPYFNIKYDETGKVFQGSYRARIINGMNYLQYIDVYVQILNPFELLTEGMPLNDFDLAFGQVLESPFSGIGESLGQRNFSILDRADFLRLSNLPTSKEDYKKFARAAIHEQGLKKFLGGLTLEK